MKVEPNLSIPAQCPNCQIRTTFEHQQGGSSFGMLIIDKSHEHEGKTYSRYLNVLLRCAGCLRGGFAVFHDNGKVNDAVLGEFYPISVNMLNIPTDVPNGIVSEFREAEKCCGFRAWRAASALFRSSLEKTLKANGYDSGNLLKKIDEAASDGIITDSRRKRAHDDIRVLGNDVLHEEWRQILSDEVEASHHYTQRILEDFYDDRTTVEGILISKGRITS
jgi:Domain of unknown function (DUF4145)